MTRFAHVSLLIVLLCYPAAAEASDDAAIRELLAQGRYPEAASLAGDLLRSAESAHGEDSLEAARAIDLLLEGVLCERHNLSAWVSPETLVLARRAVHVKERILGSEDPEVLPSLHNLAVVLATRGERDEARLWFDRALTVGEATLGEGDPRVARVLVDRGWLLQWVGTQEQNRADLERALANQKSALGPRHRDVALTLGHLGELLFRHGEAERGRVTIEEALAIQQEVLGPGHPDLAVTLSRLAVLGLSTPEDLDRSMDLLERALAIHENTPGPAHAPLGGVLMSLARRRSMVGDHLEAEKLLDRALGIYESTFGPHSSRLTWCLYEVATSKIETGQISEARSLERRAIEIADGAAARSEYVNPIVLGRLVRLAQKLGDVQGATRLLQRIEVFVANEIAKYGVEKYRRITPTVEGAYLNGLLGTCFLEAGKLAEARAALEASVDAYAALGHGDAGDSASPGDDHEAAFVLALARLEKVEGNVEPALRYAERALRLAARIFGDESPLVASILYELAEIRLLAGNPAGALDAALRSEAALRERVRLAGRWLSESQALQIARERDRALDVALTVLARIRGNVSGSAGRVLDAVVRSRAAVLDEMVARHRSYGSSREILDLLEDFATARTRLANLVVRGPSGASPDLHRRLVGRAREKSDQVERALAEISDRFRDERRANRVGLENVARALPARSAIVSFLRFRDRKETGDKAPSGGAAAVSARRKRSDNGAWTYAVFVLKAGSRTPTFIPLGPASKIEPLIDAWRREASSPPGPFRSAGAAAEQRYRARANELRRLLWDPLTYTLGDLDTVFVVPDGALFVVNFSTLTTDEGDYLIERGPEIHYLSAERDLVLPDVAPATSGLLAVANPDFNAQPGFAAVREFWEGMAETANVESASIRPVYRGARAECKDFQSLVFEPLPGSAKEIEAIAGQWSRVPPDVDGDESSGVLTLTERMANETLFKLTAPNYDTVHLATHGFFINGSCTADTESSEPTEIESGDSFLTLSGLALSGANRRAQAGEDEDDGILTAAEVGSLDLTGVRWAILSGCQTGLGRVVTGEGVLGLRRAFEVAGARSLIMSLWVVEDETARRWMEALYSARLRRRSTSESVRDASLAVLEQNRDAGFSSHPFHWGAFVATGDWR